MKKAEDSKDTDQVYTASKPQELSKPPGPIGGKPKRKSSMGPTTREARNERFGDGGV